MDVTRVFCARAGAPPPPCVGLRYSSPAKFVILLFVGFSPCMFRMELFMFVGEFWVSEAYPALSRPRCVDTREKGRFLDFVWCDLSVTFRIGRLHS